VAGRAVHVEEAMEAMKKAGDCGYKPVTGKK
jgi:hypothetical protein